MNTEAEVFLDLYKKIEQAAKENYFPNAASDDNIMGKLMNHAQLKRYKDDLNYCRVVRNFLSHNPKVGGEYPIVPSHAMINLLKKLLDIIESPPLAMEIAIKRKHLYTARPDDSVGQVMEVMSMHGYGIVPIIVSGKLVGVFTSKTVYSYMSEKGVLEIEFDAPISIFQDYYKLSFINDIFDFVSEDATILEVEEILYKSYSLGKMLRCVFITKNGSPTSSILGIVTPWDLLIDN